MYPRNHFDGQPCLGQRQTAFNRSRILQYDGTKISLRSEVDRVDAFLREKNLICPSFCFSRRLLPATARNYAEELLTAKFFSSRSYGSRRDDPNGSSFYRRPFPFPVFFCGIHDLSVFTQIIRYGFFSRKLKSDSSLRKSDPKDNFLKFNIRDK